MIYPSKEEVRAIIDDKRKNSLDCLREKVIERMRDPSNHGSHYIMIDIDNTMTYSDCHTVVSELRQEGWDASVCAVTNRIQIPTLW